MYADVDGPRESVALAAVGSLARRELGPRSDLDLVLLHDGKNPGLANRVAESLWYPLWDSRVKLDHAVRTPAQCASIAGAELSAGVGLLDLRHLAGDPGLVSGARTALLTAWRNNARKRLPELLSSLDERLHSHGDAAYLLEPDLKEARGGFRDVAMLRALSATWLTDRPHLGVAEPYDHLLDVRDALHITSGRAIDRLVASEAAEVAQRLGWDGPDALRRSVSLAARRISHAVYLTARAAKQALPQRRGLSFARKERKPDFRAAPHGLIVYQGEVGLNTGTDPTQPLLGLQAGALAAREGLALSPVTAQNLGVHAPQIPTPWSAEARESLLEMLSSGAQVLAPWEALDLSGCITRWIPAWAGISGQPQHNPIHRHTVDRHSIQTVVEAGKQLTQVDRPDILLIACLLHDIGKVPGAGRTHCAVGAPIAQATAVSMGWNEADATLVGRLVSHHLTLADLATRRDHADPVTMQQLSEAVDGRADILNLLRRLTEADARAAGPSAWSPWRAQLINALADRLEEHLHGEPHESPHTGLVDLGLARSVALDGQPRVDMSPQPGGLQLVIATKDRLGLFGQTAGLLASLGFSVRSAVLHTVDGVAVNRWRVDQPDGTDLPDRGFVLQQMLRLEAGDQSMLLSIHQREERVRPAATEPFVEVVQAASSSATVIEMRSQDRPGLLYAIGESLARARLSIRSAHISTLAGQAIDTLYLTEPRGERLSPQRAQEARASLIAAASGRGRGRTMAG